MPNDYLDKINLSGTTYDIKDTVSGYITESELPEGVFFVDIDTTNNYAVTPTASEIVAAYNDGKQLVIRIKDFYYESGAHTTYAYALPSEVDLEVQNFFNIRCIVGRMGGDGYYVDQWDIGYDYSQDEFNVNYSLDKLLLEPPSASAGQVLTYSGSSWGASAAPVTSVNGQTGAVSISIPSKVSDLTNDSGFITTETDPTVPSWAKQSSKPSYTANEVGAVPTSSVGAASGVVPLNASSKIDSTYLPSYVDDVIEGYYYNNKFYKESTHTTEITGEAGKIYIDLSTDKTYRWGGSAYAEISQGSVVSVSRDLTSGTKVGTITVNGTGTDLYAPTPPSAGTTATAVGTSTSGGSATTWSKSDHVHSISSSTITSALGFTPYNSTNPNGYTTNTGTVTQVTAGTGLKIGTASSGGDITTTGTINHINSVTAQTTQAVYPIKIDAQGHISAYGNAVTITDEKVKQTPLNGTNSGQGLLFSSGTGASETTATAYTSNKLQWNDSGCTLSIYNSSRNRYGYLQYDKLALANSSTSYVGFLKTADITVNRTYTLPDKPGTIALTDDIPTVPSAGTTATAVSTTSSGGSATTWSKSDHVHSITSSTITSALGFTPYNSTNPNNYVDATGAASAAPVQSVNGQTGAVTTTDEKVSQSLSSSNSDLPILFRNNVTGTTASTEGVRFVGTVTVTPGTGNLKATKFNDYILAAACAKAVDTSISASSSSANLPTSAAVATFVENKGYLTLSTLPIYDGTVVTNANGVNF